MIEDIRKELERIQDRLIAQAKDKIGMDDYVAQILAYQHIINDHIKQSIALAEAAKEIEDRLLKLESQLIQPMVKL